MSEWRECKLGDVATFRTGKLNSNAETPNGIYPFFTCSPETLKIDNYAFDEETLLLAGNNANGVFSLKYYKGKFNAYQRTYLISLKDVNHNDYKFLFFSLKLQLSNLEHVSHGTATKFLTLPILNGIPFFQPTFPEQQAIAAVLSSLDDKIDLLHRQNKTLEAMAETLFKQWFVVEAREDWEEGKLGNEFDFTMGQSPSGNSFNDEGNGVPMFQGNADFSFRFPSERIFTTEPTRLARKFDTLISVRAPVGAQNMAHKECCIGRGVAAFRYKYNNDYYTYTYFKLRSLMEEIKQFNNEGTVFGSISKSDFENIVIIIPSNDAVINFENNVKPINDKIIKNCYQIQTLETLRDNLLPKLMSGEVRVKT
jgi:type I restriction enzyme S subunit